MQFYSVVLKKKIEIPTSMITQVIKKGRVFAVGKYRVGAKEYQAWRVLGLAKKR